MVTGRSVPYTGYLTVIVGVLTCLLSLNKNTNLLASLALTCVTFLFGCCLDFRQYVPVVSAVSAVDICFLGSTFPFAQFLAIITFHSSLDPTSCFSAVSCPMAFLASVVLAHVGTSLYLFLCCFSKAPHVCGPLLLELRNASCILCMSVLLSASSLLTAIFLLPH